MISFPTRMVIRPVAEALAEVVRIDLRAARKINTIDAKLATKTLSSLESVEAVELTVYFDPPQNEARSSFYDAFEVSPSLCRAVARARPRYRALR